MQSFGCVSLFGVFLPLAALVFQLTAGQAFRGFWFNPARSGGFLVMIALVPLASALYLVGRPCSFLTGAAMVVSLAYTVFLAPLVPFAFMLLSQSPLGLLALSPLLSFCALLLGVQPSVRSGWAHLLGILAGVAGPPPEACLRPYD